MPRLSFGNELISKKPSKQRIMVIVWDTVEIECKFITEPLPVRFSLNELPFDGQVCSKPILELGYDKFCMINNHFDVMENIPLEGNVDFFKKQVGDYYKAANTMNENIIGSFEYFDANIFI